MQVGVGRRGRSKPQLISERDRVGSPNWLRKESSSPQLVRYFDTRVRQGSARLGRSVAPWLADCEEHHQATISGGWNAVVPFGANLDHKTHYPAPLLPHLANSSG